MLFLVWIGALSTWEFFGLSWRPSSISDLCCSWTEKARSSQVWRGLVGSYKEICTRKEVRSTRCEWRSRLSLIEILMDIVVIDNRIMLHGSYASLVWFVKDGWAWAEGALSLNFWWCRILWSIRLSCIFLLVDVLRSDVLYYVWLNETGFRIDVVHRNLWLRRRHKRSWLLNDLLLSLHIVLQEKLLEVQRWLIELLNRFLEIDWRICQVIQCVIAFRSFSLIVKHLTKWLSLSVICASSFWNNLVLRWLHHQWWATKTSEWIVKWVSLISWTNQWVPKWLQLVLSLNMN